MPFLVARAGWVLAASLLLPVAACSEEPGPAAPPTPSRSASEKPAEQTLPAPVTVDGAKEVLLRSREELRVVIPDEPDWLVEGFGSLWTLLGNGSVVRLTPQGKILATIDADIYQPPVCQGLGISADAIWACATHGKIIRIDPATNKIVATVSVPKVNEQGRLVATEGRLWLITGDGDELVGVSLADNSLGDPIQLGTFCTDLDAGADGLLWVVCASEGTLLRVDPVAAEVTGRLPILPLARTVSVAGDVWVGFESGLARVDAESLKVLEVYDIALGVTGGVRASADAVWVRQTGDPFLMHIDPGTSEVVEVIRTAELTSSGDVLEFDGALWASAYDDLTIVRLSLPAG